jgi:P27 family predicted phage terminase small subunit
VLQGNPGRRRLNAAEPKVPRADPSFDEPPTEIAEDVVASAEWRRVAPMLRLCGLVSRVERASLLALCQQWSRYLEALGKVRTLGMVVKKPSGIPVVNPYLSVSDHALALCVRLWAELGLTPSARARLAAIPASELLESEFNKWEGLL